MSTTRRRTTSSTAPVYGHVLARLVRELDVETEAGAELRELFHRLAEPSHEEHATATAARSALGADTVIQLDGAGFAVRLGSAADPAVVVRAELDALPIAEETDAPFAATNGYMHACGHDVHMAALTCLYRAARRVESELPAPLVALFQPSEEAYPSGALAIAKRAGDLGPTGAIVAAHVHPDVGWLEVAADSGSVNAAADNFAISVTGAGGHAAYPHRACDPVVALSHIVVALQHVVSRRVDPLRAAAVSVGVLRAGSAENVIPSTAEARGTLRALEDDDRAGMKRIVTELASHIAHGFGCEAKVTFVEGEPCVVNDARMAMHIRSALSAAGFTLSEPLRSLGSDDFGYLASVAPSMLVFAGVKNAPSGNGVSLHHPSFLPPVEAVRAVAQIQAATYVGAAAAIKAQSEP